MAFQKKERGGDGEERMEMRRRKSWRRRERKNRRRYGKKQCLWREGTRCGPIQRPSTNIVLSNAIRQEKEMSYEKLK